MNRFKQIELVLEKFKKFEEIGSDTFLDYAGHVSWATIRVINGKCEKHKDDSFRAILYFWENDESNLEDILASLDTLYRKQAGRKEA